MTTTFTTYDRFRRAEGAWIATERGPIVGTTVTFLNIGVWADSYDANAFGKDDAVEFVGWDTTGEGDREDFEGNFVGDRSRTVATAAEFAAFIGRPTFVSYVAEFENAYEERTI